MNNLNHVAFIMDGNGRWGKKRNKGRNYGHLQGVQTVKKIVESSIKFKIPIVSFYVFSTENWRRPKTEVKFLFSLIKSYFEKEINHNIKKLPTNIKKVLSETIDKTKKNKNLTVNLALNYGSKDELISSFLKILKKKQRINKKNITKNLYTQLLPDPDILIRTGGQKRLSNFMLWQLAYTELYFLDKLWPDFKEKDLKKIINNYVKIKRNFGSI